jgi:hypothetical protein
MRSTFQLAFAALVLGAVGCSAPTATQEGAQAQPQAVAGQSPAPVTIETQPLMVARRGEPYLLFDRHPSPVYAPESFAARRTWPAAERGFSGGEWVEFEEHLIDRERGFNHTADLTYRRFTSRRRGTSFR